jgi:hypothetical protein
MKAKILAAVIIAGAAVAPIHTAEAGRLDQAIFLAKVAKAKLIDAGRDAKKKAVCKLLPCLGKIKL